MFVLAAFIFWVVLGRRRRQAIAARDSLASIRLRGGGPVGAAPPLSGFDLLDSLRQRVGRSGAHSLKGCTVRFLQFLPLLRRAQARGFVSHFAAEFFISAFTMGCNLGVDVSRCVGQRVFRNYKSALGAREAVSSAIAQRLATHKSLRLCCFSYERAKDIVPFKNFFIFPMGAVQ